MVPQQEMVTGLHVQANLCTGGGSSIAESGVATWEYDLSAGHGSRAKAGHWTVRHIPTSPVPAASFAWYGRRVKICHFKQNFKFLFGGFGGDYLDKMGPKYLNM